MGDYIWILIPLAPFLMGALAIWTKHQQRIANAPIRKGASGIRIQI